LTVEIVKKSINREGGWGDAQRKKKIFTMAFKNTHNLSSSSFDKSYRNGRISENRISFYGPAN
jgi:hypothetical protein